VIKEGAEMSRIGVLMTCPLVCVSLAGCMTGTPIVAGAVDQVGVAISGGVQDQGGNVTIGYRGAKFAVVPVQNDRGQQLSLVDGLGKERGFSVLALLGVDAKGGIATGSQIQQVLAVGPAAEIWALGHAPAR
jgi:hypothetical protein